MTGASKSWRELRVRAQRELARAGIGPAEAEARFIVEHVSGYDTGEWLEIADAASPARAEPKVRDLVRRRVAGEPLQYVLGGWEFRGLDLFVDRRVLIPRPETEYVVEVALEEAARSGLRRSRRGFAFAEPSVAAAAPAPVADIGTGSGAIAIAIAAELPDVAVWATDVSEDALTVARAGLPEEVAAHEPRRALVSGPSGTEAIETLLERAPDWLAPGSSFVCEIAPHQAGAMVEHARALGYHEVMVRDDLTDRPRVLVARAG